MLVKYKVSKKEVIRREKSFLSLSIALVAGLVLASLSLNVTIPYLFYLSFLVILLSANLLLYKFFYSFLQLKIGLSKDFLIRIKGVTLEKFPIKRINRIKIKRTTKNNIREISFYLDDGKSLFINGLDNFEKFRVDILKRVDEKIVVENCREPINFDSLMFYPILGLLISFGTVYLLKILVGFSYQVIQIILYALLVYVFFVAIYLLVSKPISKRYGGNKF